MLTPYKYLCGFLFEVNMWNFQDLTGQKFGRLTVLKRAADYVSPSGNKIPRWLCSCECGNIKVINGANLKKGTKSCGCLQKEVVTKVHTKHGKRNTRLYGIWKGMVTRCCNSNNHAYKLYGNEGKKMCDEWRNDFQAFYEWAMANGYSDDLTIDRIDNNKGYSPDNCRWVDNLVQNNNTRRNHLITYNGKTQTIAQWARELNIPYGTLVNRIGKLHWSIEKALNKKQTKI